MSATVYGFAGGPFHTFTMFALGTAGAAASLAACALVFCPSGNFAP